MRYKNVTAVLFSFLPLALVGCGWFRSMFDSTYGIGSQSTGSFQEGHGSGAIVYDTSQPDYRGQPIQPVEYATISSSPTPVSSSGSAPPSTPSPIPTPTKDPNKLFETYGVDSAFEVTTNSAPGVSYGDNTVYNAVMINGKVYAQFQKVYPHEFDRFPTVFPGTCSNGCKTYYSFAGVATLDVKSSRYVFAFPSKPYFKPANPDDWYDRPTVEWEILSSMGEYRRWVRWHIANPTDMSASGFTYLDTDDTVKSIDFGRKIFTLLPGVATGVTEIPIGNLAENDVLPCPSGASNTCIRDVLDNVANHFAFGKTAAVYCSSNNRGNLPFRLYYWSYAEKDPAQWRYVEFPNLKDGSGKPLKANSCGFNADDGKLYIFLGANPFGRNILRIAEDKVVR